ncbi:hypothetical protein D3C87_1427520 [compost metagenome]
MKLTPTQARNKIRQELDKGNGAYICARFYDVCVKSGVLHVSYDCDTWEPVAPGSEIRNGHGRAFFTYEPEQAYTRLVVASVQGLKHPAWVEAFPVGGVVEVVRETATFFIIAALGIEQKVSKSTLLIAGHAQGGHVVQFKTIEAGI